MRGEATVEKKERSGTIVCEAIDMSVKTAREAGSGMATGRRQYDGITCTKQIDRATPLIAKALAENPVIDGTFQFWRPSASGAEQQTYTIDVKAGTRGRHPAIHGCD